MGTDGKMRRRTRRTMEDMLNPLNSLALDIRKETGMGRFLESINNVNNVTNNTRNMQPVVNHINVTCPGVTSQEVARQLPGLLDEAFDRKFSGFSTLADQWIRR